MTDERPLDAVFGERPTYGRLVAEIARWSTMLELRRVDQAFGEGLAGEVSEKALDRARVRTIEAQANLETAILALDTAIGVTPDELEHFGRQFDKSTAAAEEALDSEIDACIAEGTRAHLESLAAELRRHGWVCQAPRDDM